jgi:hypothetical protein
VPPKLLARLWCPTACGWRTLSWWTPVVWPLAKSVRLADLPVTPEVAGSLPSLALTDEVLVLELVLVSAHLTAPRGTEAGPKPRFRPQMDLA